MRQPTQAMLRALCTWLGLDPNQVQRISVLPDRVVVDSIDTDTGKTWTTTQPVANPRRLP